MVSVSALLNLLHIQMMGEIIFIDGDRWVLLIHVAHRTMVIILQHHLHLVLVIFARILTCVQIDFTTSSMES